MLKISDLADHVFGMWYFMCGGFCAVVDVLFSINGLVLRRTRLIGLLGIITDCQEHIQVGLNKMNIGLFG